MGLIWKYKGLCKNWDAAKDMLDDKYIEICLKKLAKYVIKTTQEESINLLVKGAGILELFYPFVKQGMRNIAFMADITPAFPGTIQINELLLECICIFTGVPFLLCFCQPYF